MRILVIYVHPNRKSFNRALADAVLEEAEAKGHEYELRDLYAQSFQPVLTNDDFEAFNHAAIPDDIKREQDAVTRADLVIFVYPIWWFGPPAILKGWIDRVFSYGFAYGHDTRGVKPLLTGRKAILVNTAGGSETEAFQTVEFKDAMTTVIDTGIFEFVGLDVILHRMFFQVPSATAEERREMLETIRNDMRKLL
jgi:Putative NADPH-quinone reductase (modulator of drug activity B)